MTQFLSLLNFFLVLVYGIILSFSFLNLTKGKKNHYIIFILILGFSLLQLITQLFIGEVLVTKFYPFLTHIPLVLILIFIMKKTLFQSLISVLTAYILCTPRKWIGTTIAAFFNHSLNISYIVQILITIPLILLIVKYISPILAKFNDETNKILRVFVLLPLAYYILEYSITVYSNILYEGGPALMEFLDSFFVFLYFSFSILYMIETEKRKELELNNKMISIKANESLNQINELKEFHKQTLIHRHDLRHHLQFILACINQNNIVKAKEYIEETSSAIEKVTFDKYCENETLNLIISSYISKAIDNGINCTINCRINRTLNITDIDLCGIVSNALENAINANDFETEDKNKFITINGFMKNNKLVLEITNSFYNTLEFNNNIPINKNNNRGIGTKSIISIVEKYKGMYSFQVINKTFIFKLIL